MELYRTNWAMASRAGSSNCIPRGFLCTLGLVPELELGTIQNSDAYNTGHIDIIHIIHLYNT